MNGFKIELPEGGITQSVLVDTLKTLEGGHHYAPILVMGSIEVIMPSREEEAAARAESERLTAEWRARDAATKTAALIPTGVEL